MRFVPYTLVMLCLLLSIQLLAQEPALEENWLPLHDQLSCRAIGTGQASGQIATLLLDNKGTTPVSISPQQFLVPSTGRFQGYLARIPAGLTAAPETITEIPIIGYCTDLDKPAVPAGMPINSPAFWHTVVQDKMPESGSIRVLPRLPELSSFKADGIGSFETTDAFRRDRKKQDWLLHYPTTDTPINGSLLIDQEPELCAPLLLSMLGLLEDRYQQLEDQGLVRTPLSGDALKQRETIIQHGLWIMMAELRGKPYQYEEFAALVEKALEDAGNESNTIEQEAAIKTLWSTFHRLLYQAELSNKLPTEVAQFQVLINLPEWSHLNLTSSYRKPGMILSPQSAAVMPKKRPLWLPIAGGIVVGSGLTYFLLNDETAMPVDTMEVPPPPPPPPWDTLMLTNDNYALDCLPPATLFPLENDSGRQLEITNIGTAGTAVVEQFGNDAIIISDYGGQSNFSFPIEVADSLGITATSLITITIDRPSITALDDNFSTPYATPFSANVLDNDAGEEIRVINYIPPPSGANVLLEPNGQLMVNPAADFTGTLTMEYIIQDACLQQDSAQIEITIGAPDCNFSAEIVSTPADCGFSNGSLTAMITPDNEYSLLWSNGATEADLIDLPAGLYSLTVSSNAGLCEEEFQATIEENAIEYLTSLTSGAGDCTGGGAINLALNAPNEDLLVVEWTGPEGSNSTTSGSGTVQLGELFNLLPGSYDFTIYPQSVGESCFVTTTTDIADTTILLQASADEYTTPYETTVAGNVLQNDDGQSISLTANTDPASGTLAISDNGQFSFQPTEDFTGTVNFEYTITDICGNSTNASVSIEVGAPNCNIDLSLQATNMDCGLNNGAISTVVLPTGEYEYAWSNGATTASISSLLVGSYSVTVSNEGGLCEASAMETISENPIDYIVNSAVTPGTCLGDGNITLELQSPENLSLSLVISVAGETTIFSLEPGIIELASLLDLPAGTYPIEVYPNAAGMNCSQAQEITIPDITPELSAADDSYSVNFQNPVNDNLLTNDGGLDIQLTGVTDIVGGIVNFEANGDFLYVPFNDFTGTGSFNYSIADACGNSTTATVTIEVGEPDCTFTVMISMTAANCGLADGSLLAIPSPEDNYSYLWSNGATTPDNPNLEAGNYQLMVTSNSGLCSKVFTSLVTELPANYIVSSSTSPGNCLGGGNITLELSSPDNSNFGGVIVGPGINQTLNLASGVQNLNELFNLLPGDYTITIYSVSAGFSCNQSIDVEIEDNSPAILVMNDAFSTAYETAVTGNFLGNDSGLDIVVSNTSSINNGMLDTDAAGNFTFTPDPGFAGITGFTYTVTDGCGQEDNGEVIITVSPPACNFSIELQAANAVCGLPNGMISAVVSPPGEYTYAWSTGGTDSQINDLSIGTYTLTVTGNSGFCTMEASASIVNGPPLFIDSLSTAPGNCAGDGSIIIEAYAPGNGTLDVLINGPNGSDLVTINSGFSDLGDLVNLPSGVFDLVVYPTAVGLSCNEETFAIVEDNTEEFIVNDDQYTTAFQTPVVQNVLSNDEGLLLEILSVGNAFGGTVEMGTNGDFVFTPENGATGMAWFTYTAADACTEQLTGLVTIEIGPPTCNFSVQLSTIDASCGFQNGSITAIVNPPGDYSYFWSNDSTSQAITNLSQGVYSVTVIDNNDDCPILVRDTIFENAPAYLSNLVVEAANCMEPASISFEITNSYPGVYTIEVTPPDSPTQTLQNISSGIVNLEDYLILESGSYELAVYNQNIGIGCTDSTLAVVPEPLATPAIAISNIVLPSSPGAMDGSFDVTFSTLSVAPYTITINDVDVGQSDGNPFSWTNLAPGTYQVYATDANGCVSNTASVTLTSTSPLQMGWTTPLIFPGLRDREGIGSFMLNQSGLFAQMNFHFPKRTYELRIQQLSNIEDSRRQEVLFMSLQQVSTGAPESNFLTNKKHPISWANGIAWLHGPTNSWFWHSTLRWQPQVLHGMEISGDAFIGRHPQIVIGLRHQW